MRIMQRVVTGLHQASDGAWLVDLGCLHQQTVPAGPGAVDAPMSLVTSVDCELCDHMVLPDGLTLARTTRRFDIESTPAGLRRRHRVADGVWGVLEVDHGAVEFTVHGDQPLARTLRQGDRQPIPPGVGHDVSPHADAQFRIEFWHRPVAAPGG